MCGANATSGRRTTQPSRALTVIASDEMPAKPSTVLGFRLMRHALCLWDAPAHLQLPSAAPYAGGRACEKQGAYTNRWDHIGFPTLDACLTRFWSRVQLRYRLHVYGLRSSCSFAQIWSSYTHSPFTGYVPHDVGLPRWVRWNVKCSHRMNEGATVSQDGNHRAIAGWTRIISIVSKGRQPHAWLS